MELKKSINILRILYILQIILLIIILILYVCYKNSVDWINKITSLFFYTLFFFHVAIIVPPIILFIITFFKKNYNIYFTFLKIAITLFLIRIIISIEFLVLFILTYNDYKNFYKYCPFNFKQSDIYLIFPNLINNNIILNNEEIRNKCINKRCFELNNIAKSSPHSYICNYNLAKYFNEDEKYFRKMKLNELRYNNFPEILISYFSLCNPYIDIYICNLSKKPKQYPLDINYICPENSSKSYVYEIVITSLNIIFPVSIFILQFIFYKKILKLIVEEQIQRNNSNNKTIDTSNKIDKSNKSFKKEKTEIIIIDNNIENSNEENLMKILQKSKENNNKKSIRIYKNKLLFKDKGKKIFENLKTINTKNNCNKSFDENNKEFNINDNINSAFEKKSNRLLTEVNKDKKEEKQEEKQEEEKPKYIIIKK